MDQTERLTLIHALALAIQTMSRSPQKALAWGAKINSFAETIRFLAAKPDSFIQMNIEAYEEAREEARRIIEGEKLER